MKLDIQQIKDLVQILEKSELTKINFKNKDFELLLEKTSQQAPTVYHEKITHSIPTTTTHQESQTQQEESHSKNKDNDNEGNYIIAPVVGTFYESPSPKDPPFVKIGDNVDENSIVCIIEAMKVMNEVKAGVSGKIVEMLVENGQPVEFGTKIFRVE